MGEGAAHDDSVSDLVDGDYLTIENDRCVSLNVLANDCPEHPGRSDDRSENNSQEDQALFPSSHVGEPNKQSGEARTSAST